MTQGESGLSPTLLTRENILLTAAYSLRFDLIPIGDLDIEVNVEKSRRKSLGVGDCMSLLAQTGQNGV